MVNIILEKKENQPKSCKWFHNVTYSIRTDHEVKYHLFVSVNTILIFAYINGCLPVPVLERMVMHPSLAYMTLGVPKHVLAAITLRDCPNALSIILGKIALNIQ